jgi:hypothetical protein
MSPRFPPDHQDAGSHAANAAPTARSLLAYFISLLLSGNHECR